MDVPYYKVLENGKSFIATSMKWSLPRDDKPGEWHEVSGPLERCKSGLHLTDKPLQYKEGQRLCYLTETEGETLGPYYGELVARKVRLVRLVPWEELADSPALELLTLAWKQCGKGSWAIINDVMQQALRLTIGGGFAFNAGDIRRVVEDFNAGYWIGDGESYYSLACGNGGHSNRTHGPNPSAYHSIEAWKGRKPFIVRETEKGPMVRLCVGQRFDWHLKLKERVGNVVVTSFVDRPSKPDADFNPYVVACTYKDTSRSKIDRLFKISHDDIKDYHAAIRKAAKKPTQAEAAECSS